MGFFDRVRVPEPVPVAVPPRPRWSRPHAALPGVVAIELLLARTDDTAVAVNGVLAYPNGFGFDLSALVRQEVRRGILIDPGFHHPFPAEDPLPPEFLRLGVQFADGGVVTNLARPPFPQPGAEPTGPILLPDGGGGDGRRYDMRYWVWPLPPPGPVSFVCEWPAHGIPESRAEIDGQLVLDAAGRAVQLWPEDAP